MTKTGETKVGVTRCQCCGNVAVMVDASGRTFCGRHSNEKQATSRRPLKSASEQLTDLYK